MKRQMSEGDSSATIGKREERGGEGVSGWKRKRRKEWRKREGGKVEERRRKRRSSVVEKEEGRATRHRWKRDSERVGYIEGKGRDDPMWFR